MSLKKMLVSRAAVFAASLAVLVVALLFVGAKPAHAVTFEVNTTADTADPNTADNVCDVDSTTVGNQCTLRAAIDQANATGGADTLSFNIPTSDPNRNATTGVFTITPTSALPTITQQVTIDGYTQGDGTPADPSDDATPNTQAVGNDARLLIELNGASAGTPGRIGLRIQAGMSTVRGLVINRFSGVGISLPGNIAGGVVTNNKIEGNYIGTNAAGNAPLGNGSGVSIGSVADNNTIGGTDPAARNLISGSANGTGVFISGSGNKVEGNYIGTNAAGNAPLGNSDRGVSTVADNNTIGGTDPAARNVISGNGDDGVSITQDTGSIPVQGILVQGNYIGTDAGGTADLGNRVFGVRLRTSSSTTIIGGRAAGAGNVISGNDQHGISLRDVTNHKILGNYIGTQANGTDPLGNSQAGIIFDIDASHNAVGGTRTGEPNVIAHNGNDGVSFGCCNRILSNSIYSNGTLATHLGIDLRSDGVSANDPDDADSGTNPLQNFPVLTSAERTDVDGSTTITGSLNSVPDEVFTVQFFSSPSPDPSNHGEGKTYLGLLTEVTTDLSGDASFSFTTQENLSGQVVTATATSTFPDDNTSEFSAARAVSEANDPPVNSVPGAQSTNEDSALVFSQANSNRVSVSDPDAGTNPVQVRLQVDHGTMTLDGTGGLTFSAGDGTTDADMIFTGSLTDINAALDGMSFTPAANYNGGATLTITTDDQGNTGTGGAKTDTETVTLTVNAVNDAPSFTRGPKLSVQDKAGAQSVPNWATNISKGRLTSPLRQ